ncbi:cupin domain-containing protein [Comamonas sp. GB3 AK4-5]|uniref:cupin domain-containing protein n=1 Tax=Comamonas sp. GB3 AK4-5 TaxID=3231487 RepID=UPI00351F4B0A
MTQDLLRIFDVNAILHTLPLANLTQGAAEAQDVDAFPMQTAFGTGGLYIGSFVGLTPWENHPHTDELLYAVEGEVELTLLTEAGPQTAMLRQGSVCIVPQGLWHRQLAHQPVKLLTISGDAQISWADDPRVP